MSSSPFIDKINKHYKLDPKSSSSGQSSKDSATKMSPPRNTTAEDDRGFTKTENFTMMNPREANFQETGNNY